MSLSHHSPSHPSLPPLSLSSSSSLPSHTASHSDFSASQDTKSHNAPHSAPSSHMPITEKCIPTPCNSSSLISPQSISPHSSHSYDAMYYPIRNERRSPKRHNAGKKSPRSPRGTAMHRKSPKRKILEKTSPVQTHSDVVAASTNGVWNLREKSAARELFGNGDGVMNGHHSNGTHNNPNILEALTTIDASPKKFSSNGSSQKRRTPRASPRSPKNKKKRSNSQSNARRSLYQNGMSSPQSTSTSPKQNSPHHHTYPHDPSDTNFPTEQSPKRNSPPHKSKISTRVLHQATENISKISSLLQKTQKLSKYQVYGQHPKLNFDVLSRLLQSGSHLERKTSRNGMYADPRCITVQVISSTCVPIRNNKNASNTVSAPNAVPGENGFVLCVSDGLSSMQAFIQTKQNPDAVHKQLTEIQTLCIVRLSKPSVRIMHGARVLYCTGVRTIHMPVPLIGNPRSLNYRDKIQFVRPVFSDLGVSLNGDEAVHRIVDHIPFHENPFDDFFTREGLCIDRLQNIDFLLHNRTELSSSLHNRENIHCFKKRDHELLALFEEKLSGFELEYWLIKQYLQSVVLCWKVQGKLYVYRFENVLHKHNIKVEGVEACIDGVPMFELRDENYSALRDTLKKLNLNFVVLFTNHRYFEQNYTPRPAPYLSMPPIIVSNGSPQSAVWNPRGTASTLTPSQQQDAAAFSMSLQPTAAALLSSIGAGMSPPNSAPVGSELSSASAFFTPTTPITPPTSLFAEGSYQQTWWTVEQSKHIPLAAFLQYLPISLTRSICQPLPPIFNFREDCKCKLDMIHNLLDFVFFFGKQLFFIHILKSVTCVDELMDLLFPFIERSKVLGSRRLLGLFRQFLLLNRFETERLFSSLPTSSMSRLLQIFYLDQVLPRNATLRQVVNIILDEIDMLGMQSHLRRLNPKLLQFIAMQVGVKNRSLLDEDLILYILGLCFPFVIQSTSLGGTMRGDSLSVYPAVNSGSDEDEISSGLDYETPSLGPISLVELEKEIHLHIAETRVRKQSSDVAGGGTASMREMCAVNEVPSSPSDGAAPSTSDDEDSEENTTEEFVYNACPAEEDQQDLVVGIVVQVLGDEGYIFCLSHGGKSSHYIMFTESPHQIDSGSATTQEDQYLIGALVAFNLQQAGNSIRAQNIRVLTSLNLPDEVMGNKKTIQQLMHAYTLYFCSSPVPLNTKLTDISPVAFSNSFSPYFTHQRNPAQIIGMLLRDQYSMQVRIADTLSAFAEKEYYGVVTCVEHTRGEIIEQHTWEKIIFYFDPQQRPRVGDVALCRIVHIGFVAFATSVQIVPRTVPQFTVDYDLVRNSSFFLQNELLEWERKVEMERCLQLELRMQRTEEDGEDLLERDSPETPVNASDVESEAQSFSLNPVKASELEEKLEPADSMQRYTPYAMFHIRDTMDVHEADERDFYISLCKQHISSNLWTDGMDYADLDSDGDDCEFELNLNSEYLQSG